MKKERDELDDFLDDVPETPQEIDSVVEVKITKPERRFTSNAQKDPQIRLKEARMMLDKGIIPEGMEKGFLRGDDPKLKEEFLKPLPPVCPTPYVSLNEKLDGGLEVGSVNIVTAETGIGKSTVTGEIMYHFYSQGGAIGMFALEDTHSKTAKRMTSIGHSDNLMRKDVDDAEALQIYDKYLNSDRYYQYNDFGAVDRSFPFEMRLEMAAIQMKLEHPDLSRWILIDHISMLVANGEVSDERQALDKIMNDLMRIAATHQVGFIVICHLSRANTAGASIINRLRGSGGIGQMANTVISVARLDDSPDAPEEDRNSLKVHVSKNRRSGNTGEIEGILHYNRETGRLLEDELGFGVVDPNEYLTEALRGLEDENEII